MQHNIYLTILLCALVTALMRTVPAVLLSRFRLPMAIQHWLAFIPGAIMAAIICAELVEKPAFSSSGVSLSLLAALFATLAGALTRSLFVTVLAGMSAFMALRYFFAL
ncbi:MAG: hypothetical protein XXXJIFNMEKO3_01422 [Candidatus Erwinia impunctatus]|nr:hypothetical protein XXXJIFNMEKO_01422 [Culicoides impunctatus]